MVIKLLQTKELICFISNFYNVVSKRLELVVKDVFEFADEKGQVYHLDNFSGAF